MRCKPIAVLVLVSASFYLYSQSIEKRNLTWNDFKGTPDMSSPHNAYTYWSVHYKYDTPQMAHDGTRYRFHVWNQLESRSWVKPSALAKPYQVILLAHEQGHYNLGLICALRFNRIVADLTFSSNHQAEVARIFSEVLEQVRSQERDYDRETQHMNNRIKQQEWDRRLAEQINELSSSH